MHESAGMESSVTMEIDLSQDTCASEYICQKLWDLLFASQDLNRSGRRPCIIDNSKCIILEQHNRSIRLYTVMRPDSGEFIVLCTYLSSSILKSMC